MGILHVYGQESFHDNAYIIGTLSELNRLKSVIDRAIYSKQEGMEVFFVNDGEGYILTVEVVSEDSDYIDKLAVPYTKDYAAEKREDAIYPWDTKKYPDR